MFVLAKVPGRCRACARDNTHHPRCARCLALRLPVLLIFHPGLLLLLLIVLPSSSLFSGAKPRLVVVCGALAASRVTSFHFLSRPSGHEELFFLWQRTILGGHSRHEQSPRSRLGVNAGKKRAKGCERLGRGSGRGVFVCLRPGSCEVPAAGSVLEQWAGAARGAADAVAALSAFQELASAPKDAPRNSRLRADLSRLERDIEDEDKRSHSRTIPSRHQDAKQLLARHTAGALRRLDHATSKLLDQWLGGTRTRKNASPQQVRDELAFGKRAYARMRDQELNGDREEERADRREDLPRSSSRERRREDGRSDGEERGQRSARREGDRAGARERRRWEEQSQIDKAERKAEARVEAFVTRKAQAMQRLYRKEQVPVFPVPAVRRWRIWQASDV